MKEEKELEEKRRNKENGIFFYVLEDFGKNKNNGGKWEGK